MIRAHLYNCANHDLYIQDLVWGSGEEEW